MCQRSSIDRASVLYSEGSGFDPWRWLQFHPGDIQSPCFARTCPSSGTVRERPSSVYLAPFLGVQ